MNESYKQRDNRKFHVINFNMNERARAHERHFRTEKKRTWFSAVSNSPSQLDGQTRVLVFSSLLLYHILFGLVTRSHGPFIVVAIFIILFPISIFINCIDVRGTWMAMDIFLFIFHSINGQYLLDVADRRWLRPFVHSSIGRFMEGAVCAPNWHKFLFIF